MTSTTTDDRATTTKATSSPGAQRAQPAPGVERHAESEAVTDTEHRLDDLAPSSPSLWRRFFTCESIVRSYPANS